jgi:Mrp family chromosome partitioning ATPase
MSDAHLLAAMVDVAVLVVSAGSTACATVQRAIESIGREKIAGVVLNRVEDKSLLEAKYYYNNRETAGASRDRLTSEKNQAFSDMPEVAR